MTRQVIEPALDERRPFRLEIIHWSTGLETVNLLYRGIPGKPAVCMAHWANHPEDKKPMVETFPLYWELGSEETGYTNCIRKVDLTWADLERPVVQTLLNTRPFTTVAWLKPPVAGRPDMTREVL